MNPAAARQKMVDRQIASRGIRDPLVLAAMRTVPRERFLAPEARELACEDRPLPIGSSQTMSQPFIVAYMISAVELKGDEKVLEIGTGSGYAAAVASEIAGEVYSVERIGRLARRASAVLKSLHYDNVHILHGDGTRGWPDHAPFDAIVVTAGGPCVPESLKSQLKTGGRMVIPVGTTLNDQRLVRITRLAESQYRSEEIGDVRFVPLIGEEGWSSTPR